MLIAVSGIYKKCNKCSINKWCWASLKATHYYPEHLTTLSPILDFSISASWLYVTLGIVYWLIIISLLIIYKLLA